MQFIPYLNFNGHCAEAFAFYAQLFGGTIVHQTTFGELPEGELPEGQRIPAEARGGILHAQLQIGTGPGAQTLMGSDAMPGAGEGCAGGYSKPQGMWVSISAASVDEGRRVFDALAAGGSVAMPFEATFWSPGFGMVTDRFGTPWMVNVAA